jgi:hypothetical protein
MSRLRAFVVVLGILNLLAAIALYFGAGFALGMSWLGSFDLYAALDMEGVIDHEKLAARDPALSEHYALGHRLIDVPVGAGYQLITVGAVALALDGIALLIGAALTRRPHATQAVAQAADEVSSEKA